MTDERLNNLALRLQTAGKVFNEAHGCVSEDDSTTLGGLLLDAARALFDLRDEGRMAVYGIEKRLDEALTKAQPPIDCCSDVPLKPAFYCQNCFKGYAVDGTPLSYEPLR